jgi:hypothetical protein
MTYPHCHSRQARQHTRATGYIQYAFAWVRTGTLDEVRSP